MKNINFLGNNPNVSITITARDLQDSLTHLVDSAIDRYKSEVGSNPDDILYDSKRVCEILGIDPSTLHRWAKKEYLIPIYVGGLRRYRKSQIDDIINSKNNSNL